MATSSHELELAFEEVGRAFRPFHEAIKRVDALIAAQYPKIVLESEIATLGRMIAEGQTTSEMVVHKLKEMQNAR